MSDKADIRVVIAIPTAGMVTAQFAHSLAGLTAHFAASCVPPIPELSISMMIRIMESTNWITNREKLARIAVDEDFTHLLFLDDDMVFDPRVLETLLSRRQDIVVTNYLIKTEPAKDFVAVDLKGRRVPTKESSVGLQALSYSGFGVSLIKTDVFKAIPQPWFLPEFVLESCDYTTEDNPFFKKAREAGFKVYLDQEASKMVGHTGRRTWFWHEVKNG